MIYRIRDLGRKHSCGEHIDDEGSGGGAGAGDWVPDDLIEKYGDDIIDFYAT